MMKTGFASQQEPQEMFPTVVGRPMLRYDAGLGYGQNLQELMVGDAANDNRAMLQLNRPIENGVIKHWDDMELVWEHTFEKLGIIPSEHQIVQTEAALNPPKNREKIVEIMMEKYGFAGVNVSVQAILALASQGLDTGFVVDAGDGVTHLVPVTHGYLDPSLVKRVDLAGRSVTSQLMNLLVHNGHPLNHDADFETVREMKQKLCYVAYDLEAEKKLARETTLVDKQYTLPDSKVLRIGNERFLAPEILFNPSLMGNGELGGLAENVFNTIRRAALDVQQGYFAHIMLSGGTTMFPGLSSRLEKDLKKLYLDKVLQGDKSRQNKFKISVKDPPRRQHMVFHGASLLAHGAWENPVDNYDGVAGGWWITPKEYKERGPSAVHRLIATKLS